LPEAPAPDRDREPEANPLQPPSAALPLLRKVIAQMDDEDGWVGLGGVGQRLANLAPDFDPRTYGHAKLGDLVRKTGSFEVDRPEGRGMRIRLKPAPKRRTGKKDVRALTVLPPG
ncbi:MAG TPA: OST-HTH/LOTUS domain-containing protein, partial [Geminicoccaceae bacterium]|nr:OST-HTH/LOTUS domain-containing protein [Geminicoccaceae bacterium]